MRGCLLTPMLAVLLVANGYAVWQIHLLRGEVAALRAQVGERRGAGPGAMLDLARDAAEALGRGEMRRAEDDLRRLEEALEQAQEMVRERRQAVSAQLDRTRQAVRRGSSRARDEAEALVDMLSQGGEGGTSQ